MYRRWRPILTLKHVPISRLTSFQNAGSVPEVVVCESVDEVSGFVKTGRPFRMLGRGSNTIVRPDVDDTVIMKIDAGAVTPTVDGVCLTVGAGVTVSRLMQIMQEFGLGGLEFSAGVPASVGGMVAMNFGCWGYEIASFIASVQVVLPSGEVEWMPPEVLGFGYRTSIFHSQSWVVCAVRFKLAVVPCAEVKALVHARIQERVSKQPLRGKTFGSIFKNPHTGFAGHILDQLGYRGRSFGSVQISDQHANFMLNCDHATFEDVQHVLSVIIEDVRAKTGVVLEPEVCFLP